MCVSGYFSFSNKNITRINGSDDYMRITRGWAHYSLLRGFAAAKYERTSFFKILPVAPRGSSGSCQMNTLVGALKLASLAVRFKNAARDVTSSEGLPAFITKATATWKM